ncbi:MAG: hypothetical protein J6D08_18205 [Lachnospiraceae bacterium]|nr:hypothetical protein [Lachnospiraceae bacterium]
MEPEQNKRMTKDAIIQELIALLNQSQQKEAANSVFEMAALIDGMEQKLDLVTEELLSVRKQLERMEQEKANKSLKAVLKKSVDSLEQQCHKMKEQLFEIKEEVRGKASEIVAEVKQKGKKALNKVSEFLGIKEKLQKFRNNVQKSITDVEQSIEKIDALGTGMREAVQKAANTIRVFANKPEKEYGEKQFSKTELIKKPFQAKRKLLSGILNCADAAIEKTEQLAADVKQYQTDKTERETGSIGNMETVNPAELARVAEPEFQYGAEAFEAHQQQAEKTMIKDNATKNVPVNSGKSR